jgi:hypothetical protein
MYRHIPDQETLKTEISVRQKNAIARPLDWRFTSDDAQIKLKKLYPT